MFFQILDSGFRRNDDVIRGFFLKVVPLETRPQWHCEECRMPSKLLEQLAGKRDATLIRNHHVEIPGIVSGVEKDVASGVTKMR